LRDLKCGHKFEVGLCTISEHVLCKCASVSGTELHLLHIAMYCWKMKSLIDRSYTGTHILYKSAIATLK